MATVTTNNSKILEERFNETVFRCRHCALVIGVCTPKTLIIGMARFNKTQTFECMACERTNRWESNKCEGDANVVST